MKKSLTLADYEALAELRYQIRRFLHFSEQASRAAGLEPRQHQLLLALKGLPKDTRPRIGELAERLQIQHHSTVELVNRLANGGYVRRERGGEDHREVLISLTPKGERCSGSYHCIISPSCAMRGRCWWRRSSVPCRQAETWGKSPTRRPGRRGE